MYKPIVSSFLALAVFLTTSCSAQMVDETISETSSDALTACFAQRLSEAGSSLGALFPNAAGLVDLDGGLFCDGRSPDGELVDFNTGGTTTYPDGSRNQSPNFDPAQMGSEGNTCIRISDCPFMLGVKLGHNTDGKLRLGHSYSLTIYKTEEPSPNYSGSYQLAHNDNGTATMCFASDPVPMTAGEVEGQSVAGYTYDCFETLSKWDVVGVTAGVVIIVGGVAYLLWRAGQTGDPRQLQQLSDEVEQAADDIQQMRVQGPGSFGWSGAPNARYISHGSYQLTLPDGAQKTIQITIRQNGTALVDGLDEAFAGNTALADRARVLFFEFARTGGGRYLTPSEKAPANMIGRAIVDWIANNGG